MKSAKSSADKLIMKANGREFRLKKEVHDEISKLMKEFYRLEVFPKYMESEFTKSGQPLFNRIYDPAWPRVYLFDNQIKTMVNQAPFPHYELSHHLYAQGPLQIGTQKEDYGIQDVAAFVNSPLSDRQTLLDVG